MEFMAIVLSIIFGMIVFMVFVMIFVIAGKDIIMAFQRRFNSRGCSIFMLNPNRNVSSYYKTPKDGLFKINKLPYLTNPDKVLNLDEPTKLKVIDSTLNHTAKLNQRIAKLQQEKMGLSKLLEGSKDYEVNVIKQQMVALDNLIIELQGKLKNKTQNYFKDKRPCFFFIEGDPLPKDMHEFMSTMDNTVMDNMMARKISDPKNEKQDKQLNNLKLFITIAMFAAGAAAVLAFQNHTALLELCTNAGITCGGL